MGVRFNYMKLPKPDFYSKPYIEISAMVVLFACLAAATALFIQHMVQAAFFRYPLDYGEAPLVDQALRLAAGQNIYRPNLDTPPYTISNYPPLYPLALAVLVKVFGPSMVAARLLSIACVVLTALLLGGIIGALTRDRVAAVVSGLIFLAFPFVLGWAKLARVDLLALALSTAGLYALVRRPASRPISALTSTTQAFDTGHPRLSAFVRVLSPWRGVISGGLLLVAAIYTRQSYALAAPLAAVIWQWTQDRRRAVGLAALVGGLSLALFLVLNALTAGGFFFNVVTANANAFKMDNLAHWWRQLRTATPVLLILGALYLVSGIRLKASNQTPAGTGIEASAGFSRDEPNRLKPRFPILAAWPLLAPYLAGAALSALTIGKIGSNMNYLLELCAALSLVAGAWVAGSQAWPCSGADSTSGVTAPADQNLAELPVAHTSPAKHPERKAIARSRRMRSGFQPGPHHSTTPVIVPTGSAQGASEVAFRTALLLALAVQAVLLMRYSLRDPVPGLAWRMAQPRGDLAELERIAAGADAPILADEFMGMLTLHGKPLYIQPFEVTQLADAGLWDQAPLLADIRARAFPAILIHHFPGYPVYQERWTPEMLDAILANYAASTFLAETIVYRPRDPTRDLPANAEACPGAPWRLPTRSELGAWWLDGRISFMGEGYERSVPVYAVADGRLTRGADWNDTVAIRHDDPLHPGQVVWTYYGGMASGWGGWTFIEPRFTLGSKDIPVKRGDLLGFQGQFSAQLGTPTWVHLEFTVLPAGADGGYPEQLSRGQEASGVLDPAPYLGIEGRAATGQAVWMPLYCLDKAP